MKAKTLVPLRAIGDAAHLGWHPVGTVFEGDQALFFTRIGACEPLDEECKAAHGMTEEQLKEAQFAYRATAAGIWPEDYELFRDEVITGYDLDGNYVPGANWKEPEEPDPEEETSE